MSKIQNAEIKARCLNADEIHNKLLGLGAEYKGSDRQVDKYFNVPEGRLKLRSGNIENSLIFYKRSDSAEVRGSSVHLEKLPPASTLDQVLNAALGIKVVVEKIRKIYFIDNVKFHLDVVEGLGEFVEIEVIDLSGSVPMANLEAECSKYVQLLGISQSDFIAESYSDLLAQ